VLEEIHLELEAQEDVEVVGELVSLRPYLRRPDGVDGPVEGLDVAGDAGEGGLQPWEEVDQKALERATRFSQRRDWDSWMPIETPPARGVRE
jgi:hypothetical protein